MQNAQYAKLDSPERKLVGCATAYDGPRLASYSLARYSGTGQG